MQKQSRFSGPGIYSLGFAPKAFRANHRLDFDLSLAFLRVCGNGGTACCPNDERTLDERWNRCPCKTPPNPALPRRLSGILGLFIIAPAPVHAADNTLGFVMWSTSTMGTNGGRSWDRVAPRFAKEQGHGWQWCDELQKNMRRWSQLTLQDEQWKPFAPDVGKGCCFPSCCC